MTSAPGCGRPGGAAGRGFGWDRGTDPDYLADLVTDWADRYDWRRTRSDCSRCPGCWTGRGETSLRAVHQPAAGRAGGRAAARLAGLVSPLRSGAAAARRAERGGALPARLPVRAPVPRRSMSTARWPRWWAAAMAELGYDRYVVSGGDIGSSVAEYLAAAHPDRVAALHLTDIPYTHLFTVDPSELTRRSSATCRGSVLANGRGRVRAGAVHQAAHAGAGLDDSPAGLAAWIVEKLRSWSDCGGDVESVFPRDELLTWITLYWVTEAIGTSFSPYVENPPPITEQDRRADGGDDLPARPGAGAAGLR